MEEKKKKIKLILYPILYWTVFVIVPYKVLPLLINNGSLLFDYFLVIPLILLFIPYKLANLEDKKDKIYFIILGLVVPLILHYTYLCHLIFEAFKNSNFPF